MTKRCILWELVMVGILLIGAVRLSAQMSDAPVTASHTIEPAHVYKSEASVVSLGVTVTDMRQHQIRGLAKEDFAIFEDGRPQELRYFAAEPTPLDLAILLDTSGSMSTILADVQDAALQLAGALRPGDRASFTEIKHGMNELHPLSADTSGLARAIRATTPGGSTGLFDAIYVTLNTLRPPGALCPQQMSRLLMGDSVKGDYVLRSFAEQTGGRAFFGVASKDLARTCRRIADELAEQYSIGYVSSNARNDGRFRQVSVRVVTPAGVCARTRPGYFATSALSHGDKNAQH